MQLSEKFNAQDKERLAAMSELAGLLFHKEDDSEVKGLLGGICMLAGILAESDVKSD